MKSSISTELLPLKSAAEVFDATVETVFIHEDKTLEIIFKYHDVFKQTEKYLENLRKL